MRCVLVGRRWCSVETSRVAGSTETREMVLLVQVRKEVVLRWGQERRGPR